MIRMVIWKITYHNIHEAQHDHDFIMSSPEMQEALNHVCFSSGVSPHGTVSN